MSEKLRWVSQKWEKPMLAANVTVLGAFVLGHAAQAKYGVQSFSDHLVHFSATRDSDDVLFAGIDATYATVNAAVTVRQVSLLHTLSKIRQRKNSRRLKNEGADNGLHTISRKRKFTPLITRDKVGACAAAFIVTAGGQALFSASRHNADTETHQLQCEKTAENLLEQHFEQDLSKPTINNYRRDWSEWCGVNPSDIRLPYQAASTAVPID